jgi:hypothetical protein
MISGGAFKRGNNGVLYIRGRVGDLFVYLLVALPLPATCEILIGLNDSIQARLRIIIFSLNSICNVPYKIFRCFDILRSYSRMLDFIPVT